MMRGLAPWIAVLVLLAPACSKKNQAEKLVELVKPHVDEGFKAFSEQNYPRAIKAWEEALRINPKLDYIQPNLGLCYYASGQRDKALSLWMAYKEANPKDAQVFNNIGGFHRDAGEQDKAVEYYEQAAKLNPYYFLPYYNIGLIRYDQGRYAEALESLAVALKIAPKDIRTLVLQGRTYRAAGNDAGALDAFQKAKLFAPADPYSRFELGMELLRVNKLDQARNEFTEILADFPNHHFAYYGMASLNLRDKQLEKTPELIAKGKELSPKDAVLYQGLEGELLIAQNKAEEGIALLRQAAGALPPGFEVQKASYLFLVGRHDLSSNPDKATEMLRESLKLYPTAPYRQEIQQLIGS